MRDQEQQPISPAEPDLRMPGGGLAPKEGSAPSFLDDSEAFQDFVRSLYAKIKPKLDSTLDDEIQIEIAGLTRLLSTLPPEVVEHNRIYFETAFDLIAADQPNLLIIKSIRYDVASIQQQYSGIVPRVLLKICGKTPLTSLIAALITAFVLSFIVVIALSAGHKFVNMSSSNLKLDFPLFFAIKDVPVGQYFLAIHAAFLGSIVSVIVRIRDFLNSATFNSLLIYFSVLTKPFIAATFAILAFSVMKAGLVSFLGVDLSGPAAPYIAWTVGFLSGFSERLAQDFATRAEGVLGESPTPNTKRQ
jgi:hypothetical protein